MARMEFSSNLIHKLHSSFTGGGIHFAAPIPYLRTDETHLVRGVLQMVQGLSSSLFYWDEKGHRFNFKDGIYVAHLSQTSLCRFLDQFTYSATCLQLVEFLVKRIDKSKSLPSPTMRAFSCAVSQCLRRIRDVALKEEEKINSSDGRIAHTLLGLSSSLSSLCSGAEYLLQIVNGAIPRSCFELDHYVPAAEIAVHILNHLYLKLTEVCLVQGGEENAYRMVLYILVGSLLPYIECLDSWIFQGTLDDPFEEMFFVANKEVTVDEAEFWEKSYKLRQASSDKLNGKEINKKEFQVCPFFLKDTAKAILSAGKSLQLIQHAPMKSVLAVSKDQCGNCPTIVGLTLSEVFCMSLIALVGHGDHIADLLWEDGNQLSKSIQDAKDPEETSKSFPTNSESKKLWQTLLDDTLTQKREIDSISYSRKGKIRNLEESKVDPDAICEILQSYYPENPAITVCHETLRDNMDALGALSISRAFQLPPLNDDGLRQAVFDESLGTDLKFGFTDYTSGFQFGESERLRFLEDAKMLEVLLPFPTLLPSFQEDLQVSEVLPFQNNSTLQSKILSWVQRVEPKSTPLPAVILQEGLILYIKKQADYIGRKMLSKLLHDWRLLDELAVLRGIYLLGSGDLLQHFLSVVFNKLDKGEALDDDFELNTVLQESIRNSADNVLLSTPDSLIVSASKNLSSSEEEQQNTSVSTPRKGRGQNSAMDVIDSLKFTYKVSWPLELIVNLDVMKKYNQVMSFLLKVKRAKFVLDKTRRWMWKDRGTAATKHKCHWLLEQKLLHFVDAFHQYVMERVYHNAWRELCEGIARAGSLDEAIEVHDAYLLSIQRQCFVVPDKLWGLIASRINNILGLTLDFYSVQQTLSSGATISAIKTRCEKELARIEKQFDDSIAFLLRILSVKLNVGQFPHLAALVTRINYNCYYMSDAGNLVSAPGSRQD